jgi:hypothetical protein
VSNDDELESLTEVGNFYTLNGVVDIARCQSKRIKLLEQRIIDLQGHDDLSYIDKKLSEQEEVERLRAKKKQIYEDLKDAVEAKLKEKNGE